MIDLTDNSSPSFVRRTANVITVTGILNAASGETLLDICRDSPLSDTLTLDISGVKEADVLGINALISVFLDVRQRDGTLIIDGVHRHLGNIFHATRIDEEIAIHLTDGFGKDGDSPDRRPPAWAAPVETLSVRNPPAGAVNKNVDGRTLSGPLQGFGPLWEKRYRIRLVDRSITPEDAIGTFRDNFPRFQPRQNRFFPGPAGITPGATVIINAATPGGTIATGVWVLHGTADTFTFMTPQGHPESGWVTFRAFREQATPESGWVTFRAFREQATTVVEIVGFARSGDPLYELGFRIAGSRLQESIWRHVLTALGNHLGSATAVEMENHCVAPDLRWNRAGNIRYNAQGHTLFHSLTRSIRGIIRSDNAASI